MWDGPDGPGELAGRSFSFWAFLVPQNAAGEHGEGWKALKKEKRIFTLLAEPRFLTFLFCSRGILKEKSMKCNLSSKQDIYGIPFQVRYITNR